MKTEKVGAESGAKPGLQARAEQFRYENYARIVLEGPKPPMSHEVQIRLMAEFAARELAKHAPRNGIFGKLPQPSSEQLEKLARRFADELPLILAVKPRHKEYIERILREELGGGTE